MQSYAKSNVLFNGSNCCLDEQIIRINKELNKGKVKISNLDHLLKNRS